MGRRHTPSRTHRSPIGKTGSQRGESGPHGKHRNRLIACLWETEVPSEARMGGTANTVTDSPLAYGRPATVAWTPIASLSLPCAGTQDSIGCHRAHGAFLFVWPKTTIPRKHSATARDLLIVSVGRACQSRPNTIPSSLSCQ